MSKPIRKIMCIFVQMEYMMEQLAKFVSDHLGDDTSKLLLARGKWPEIDMDLAVNCIESRRKLKGKVQDWFDNPRLIFQQDFQPNNAAVRPQDVTRPLLQSVLPWLPGTPLERRKAFPLCPCFPTPMESPEPPARYGRSLI